MNDTPNYAPIGMSIYQLLQQYCAPYGDRPALNYYDKTVTYSQLLQGIDHAGRRFNIHIGNTEGQGTLQVPFDISGFAAAVGRGKAYHGVVSVAPVSILAAFAR